MTQHALKVFGLSGGIATGKSTCCRCLRRMLPELVVFDADESVRSLYEDEEVLDQLKGYFGNEVILPDQSVDKSMLRRRVFANPGEKFFLEEVFHPRVRQECLALLEQTARNAASRLFVADIPLLFESGFDFGQSANLLVATTRQTQVDRLKNRSAWDDSTVEAVLSAQMPIERKMTLADLVFWNEGPEDVLNAQCQRFLQHLQLIPI